MKKALIFLFIITASMAVHSQIRFEEGYLIDNASNRMKVLILNRDWKDNPTRIDYKTDEGDVRSAGVEDIKEFGIGENIRYQSHLAPLDQSGVLLKDLSTTAEPIFEERKVFLRQLVDGKADLYYYKKGLSEFFFYSKEDEDLQALISKKYKVDNRIAENNSFRQQLYSNLNCLSKPVGEFRNLDYSEEDLVDFFVEYNTCENQDYQVFVDEKQKGKLNLFVKGGVQFSSMTVATGIDATGAEFSFDPGVKVGIEAEYVMPFNRNKWALFLEPTYQSHTIKNQLVNNTPYEFNNAYLTMDLQSISMAGGARHYLFLNNSSKLFINAGLSFDLPVSSKIVLDRRDSYELQPELDEVTTEACFLFGVGYNHSNRISAEVRYYSSKNIKGAKTVMTQYVMDWDSSVNTFAVVLGYRFL